LDVSLKVGSISQVVEVQGDVSQVDTVSATLGKVETTQRILQLPPVERDTLQLRLLQAGVFAPDQDYGSGNPFSVSGQRSESMTFLLNGAQPVEKCVAWTRNQQLGHFHSERHPVYGKQVFGIPLGVFQRVQSCAVLQSDTSGRHDWGDSLFGQISSDRGPRVIQFALKMYF
jgi:hypothetical protein